MTTLGVGIIGAGNISASYLRLSPLFEGFEIRAIADLNDATAQARATEFGIRACSVPDLLASDDIDVVVNLTIPAAHFDITCQILKAGKHAYSEKPVVLTKHQAMDLATLANESGLRVGSAPDTFLGGTHQLARHQLDAGIMGDVVAGTAYIMGRGMEHWHPNPDFFFQPGAGPVLDMGPYYITNLVQLLGPVTRVGALSQTAFHERTIACGPRDGETVPVETPTTLMALIEFASGAVITLGSSWDVKSHRHSHMELYGKTGAMFLPDPNFFGGPLEIADGEGTVTPVPAWDHPFGIANQDLDSDTPQANYRCAGLAEMIQSMHENRPHRCSLEVAVHVVDVLTAILDSATTRNFVDIETTCARPEPLGPEAARSLMKS